MIISNQLKRKIIIAIQYSKELDLEYLKLDQKINKLIGYEWFCYDELNRELAMVLEGFILK